MVGYAELERITVEVVLNLEPARLDSVEEAAARRSIEQDKIKAARKGQMLTLPSELGPPGPAPSTKPVANAVTLLEYLTGALGLDEDQAVDVLCRAPIENAFASGAQRRWFFANLGKKDGPKDKRKETKGGAASLRNDPALATDGVVVEADRYIRGRIKSVFGRVLTDAELIAIASAPHGSKVRVEGGYDNSLVLVSSSEQHNATRVVKSGVDGELLLVNKNLEITQTGTGLGTKLLARQVETAGALGIVRIETHAGGRPGGKMNGYYTWPRLGYDAETPLFFKVRTGRTETTLQELFQTKEGRQAWKERGDEVLATFDPKPGSRSRQVLDAYVQERFGDKPTENAFASAAQRRWFFANRDKLALRGKFRQRIKSFNDAQKKRDRLTADLRGKHPADRAAGQALAAKLKNQQLRDLHEATTLRNQENAADTEGFVKARQSHLSQLTRWHGESDRVLQAAVEAGVTASKPHLDFDLYSLANVGSNTPDRYADAVRKYPGLTEELHDRASQVWEARPPFNREAQIRKEFYDDVDNPAQRSYKEVRGNVSAGTLTDNAFDGNAAVENAFASAAQRRWYFATQAKNLAADKAAGGGGGKEGGKQKQDVEPTAAEKSKQIENAKRRVAEGKPAFPYAEPPYNKGQLGISRQEKIALPVEDVPLGKLVTVQKTVSSEKVDYFLGGGIAPAVGEPMVPGSKFLNVGPWAVKTPDGKYYLEDGNTRLSAEAVKGADTVPLKVVRVDAEGKWIGKDAATENAFVSGAQRRWYFANRAKLEAAKSTKSTQFKGGTSKPDPLADKTLEFYDYSPIKVLDEKPLGGGCNTSMTCAAPPPVDGYAVYKPALGERTVYEPAFPTGTLYKREAAASALDEELGFGIVPKTVVGVGSAGVGSVQKWSVGTAAAKEEGYQLMEKTHTEQFAKLAVFDLLTANVDRHRNNYLIKDDGNLVAIDNGFSFPENKHLNAVKPMMTYAGRLPAALPASVVAKVEALKADREAVSQRLREHLTEPEIESVWQRADMILQIKDTFAASLGSVSIGRITQFIELDKLL